MFLSQDLEVVSEIMLLCFRCCFLFSMLTCASSTLFVGDTSLWDYLQQWCQSSSRPNHDLLLFDTISFTDKTKRSKSHPLRDYLDRHSCPYFGYQNISMNFVEQRLSSTTSAFRTLLVVFDLSDQHLLEFHLARLSQIYFLCSKCHYPFIVVSQFSSSKLHRLALEANPKLPRSNFRATLVSLYESQAIHIRPVINGCHQVNTVVIANNQQVFRALKATPSECNLNGSTLNVSVNKSPLLCRLKIVRNVIQPLYSLEFELLKTLAARYNFRTNFIDANQSIGHLVKGRYWTGLVGHVYNLTSHIGMCGVSVTEQRQKYIEYSNVVYYDQLSFLSKAPGMRSRKWIIVLPYTPHVWFMILSSFILLVTTIKLCSPRQSLSDTTIHFVGIIFKQQLDRVPTADRIRVFYGYWFLATLILSNSYGGHFYSMLALPEMEPPIDKVDEVVQLAKEDKIWITTYRGGSYLAAFREATVGAYYHIGQNINRTGSRMGYNGKSLINIVEQNPIQTVMITSRVSLIFNRLLYAHRPLHIASDNFGNDNYAFIFAKRSPLYHPFNRVIKKAFEHGLIKHWVRGTYYQTTGALRSIEARPNANGNFSALKLPEFYSIFIFWTVGNALALLSFLFECLDIYGNCRRKVVSVSTTTNFGKQ